MKKHKKITMFATLALTTLLPASSALAVTADQLGAAKPFGVLAGTAVENQGATLINGDLGAGTTLSGSPTVNGSTHINNAATNNAQGSLSSLYNQVETDGCSDDVTGEDLAGKTLTPGAYCSESSLTLQGAVVLNAQGNPNAEFVIRSQSTLFISPDSRVTLTGGAQACNVYVQSHNDITIGARTQLVGNYVALRNITSNTGVNVEGRLLTRQGEVELNNTKVSKTTCAKPPTPPTPPAQPVTPPAPQAPPAQPAPPVTPPAAQTPPESVQPETQTKPRRPSNRVRIRVPSKCMTKTIPVRVRGSNLASVRVGKRVVRVRNGRSVTLKFKARDLRPGASRVALRVRFKNGKTVKRTVTLKKCKRAAPKFTG